MAGTIHCCDRMRDVVEGDLKDEIPLTYSRPYRQYGIDFNDGGMSYLVIGYCPWCGKKLPPEVRARWFDEMERLGVDPGSDEIPEEYRDETWYQKLGL